MQSVVISKRPAQCSAGWAPVRAPVRRKVGHSWDVHIEDGMGHLSAPSDRDERSGALVFCADIACMQAWRSRISTYFTSVEALSQLEKAHAASPGRVWA